MTALSSGSTHRTESFAGPFRRVPASSGLPSLFQGLSSLETSAVPYTPSTFQTEKFSGKPIPGRGCLVLQVPTGQRSLSELPTVFFAHSIFVREKSSGTSQPKASSIRLRLWRGRLFFRGLLAR